MLLIPLFGKFCSFYKLFMLKLLSQFKYEEFEPNSALKIRDKNERRVENAKKLELQEIWQGAKFSQLAKFSQVALFIMRNFHPAHYLCLLHNVPFSHTVLAVRLKFCFLFPFFISSHFVLVTINCFC